MIVAGFGFRKSASLESLRDAYDRACAGCEITHLATLAEKVQAAAFTDLGQELGIDATPIRREVAARISTVTQSPQSERTYGPGSVAEATALAAAGTGAHLIQRRVVSKDGMATCAIAQSSGQGETR